MKKIVCCCAVLCLGQVAFAKAADIFNPYQTAAVELVRNVDSSSSVVAVAGFSYSDGRDSLDGGIVRDRLTTELVKFGKCKVIERKALEKVLQELKLQRSGAIDPASVKNIGKMLGADWLVLGTLARLEDKKIELNARLVGVESGAIKSASRTVIFKDWEDQYREVISSQTRMIEKTSGAAASSAQKTSQWPANAQLFYDRGVAYTDLGEYDNALASFGLAVTMDQAYAKAYQGRGYVYYLTANYLKAIEDFTRALVASPGDADAYFKRAFTYDLTNDCEHAVEDYSKAIAINPNSSILYLYRAATYSRCGKPEKQLKDLSKAIEVDPNNADAYYARAVFYSKNGRFDKAKIEYDTAKVLDTKYTAAEYKINIPLKKPCLDYDCLMALQVDDLRTALHDISSEDKAVLVATAKKKVRACFPEKEGRNIVVPPEIILYAGEDEFLQSLCRAGLLNK